VQDSVARGCAARNTELGSTVDCAPALLWTLDDRGHCDWFNQRWLDYCGLSPEQSFGDAWLQALHPDDAQRWRGVWQVGLEAQSSFDLDLRLRGHDGVYRWMLVSAAPRKTADASRCGYVASAVDIHQRVENEERLAERTRALRLADRQRERFGALSAHELRNALAPIANATGMLRLMERQAPWLLGARKIIERQLDHLTRIVNDMVDVSEVSQAKSATRRALVDIAEVVRTAVDSTRALIDTHGHTLQIDMPEGPIRVVGDPSRLAQAISNLLSNAARYTPHPGMLTLSVRHDANCVRVGVKDPGEGIDSAFLPRLFEPFAQHDRQRSRAQGGLGVGLTIAKRIARLHGGELDAFSEGAGLGAEFVLSLPLDPRRPLSVEIDEGVPA